MALLGLRMLVFGAIVVALAGGCTGLPAGASGELGASSHPATVPTPAGSTAPGALALTPPMGFNDWNAFGCDVSEKLIRETADVFVSSGLSEVGYSYVNIDDCWSLRERGPDGRLVPDPVKFPSGIRGVADYVHGLGLKLGIYGDAGTKTCAGYPGSLGKEKLDAQTWADWGVDYLKYDNCYNQSDGSREDFVRRYTAMREAIDLTGRPMVYSICEWGQSKPWEWAAGIGHLWRTTGDISDNWASLRSIIAANAPLAEYAGPGHWNDPDMLEIGNGGMSHTEYRTHMSLWSIMAAPLIIGTDLRKASAETLAIVGNRELILVDQDPLGKQAVVVSDSGGRMVFAKPLAGGDIVVALYNSTDAVAVIGVAATDAGLPKEPAYRLKDLWSGVSMHAGAALAAGVPAHGAVVYRASALTEPGGLPPSLSVGAELSTLIPSVPGGATLTATASNQGITDAAAVALAVEVPRGWVVAPSAPTSSARLAPGAALTTRWNVTAPADTRPGSYPLTITARYGRGDQAAPTSLGTELIAAVVAQPPDGVTHLSELAVVRAESAFGPVERDMSNGGSSEGDGNLITLGGKVYTRGLGTRATSEVVYYLGGRCSKLTTEVGIDDELTTSGAALFQIRADDKVVAQSSLVKSEDPARALSANVTGATWLSLVTQLADPSYGPVAPADWALPKLTCGTRAGPSRREIPIFSFESGTESFTLANPATGGSFTTSTAFHTDGASGLEVTSPADGNWFGRSFPTPLNLGRASRLAFDVKTGSAGTVGEFAVQVGDGASWCQGGRWAWVNPSSTKTIQTAFAEMSCPAGVRLDQTQIKAVWVFLKGGTFVIDQVRAE
jgi:alpha-galactosidase